MYSQGLGFRGEFRSLREFRASGVESLRSKVLEFRHPGMYLSD